MVVLIVDDDSGARGVLSVAMTARSWDVLEAPDGAGALEVLATNEVDAVVTDGLMPRMDGFQLCREIRSDPGLKGVAVVFYTGVYTDDEDRRLGEAVGADRVMSKPSSPDEVCDAVELVLAERRAGFPLPLVDRVREAPELAAYDERLVQKLEAKLAELSDRTRDLHQCMEVLSDEVAVKERLIDASPLAVAPGAAAAGPSAALAGDVPSVRLEELARLRAEVSSLRERLESGLETKAAVLAEISHELKTPLNTIIGFTGVLLQGLAGPLTEEQRRQLDMVSLAGGRLLGLVNDVVELARLQANQITLTAAEVNARQLVEDAVDAVRPQADDKGVRLVVDMEPNLPPLRTDSRRLQRMLQTLVETGVRATYDGTVLVSVHLRPDGSLVAAVKDEGDRIEPDDLPHVFDEFHQAGTVVITRLKGTGLRMAILRHSAELLGGSAQVESPAEGGAIFTVVVPPMSAETGDGDGSSE